jgi:hypothetical protein
MRRAWVLVWCAPLAVAIACAEEKVYVSPPSPADLPPCPRVVEHPYDPDAAPTATATVPAPDAGATSRTNEVLAEARPVDAGAAAPPKDFARTTWRPKPRAPLPVNATACGDKKNPCPLQRWMRDNVASAVAANDSAALARALDRTAALSPDPTWTWKAVAAEAADAARRGDIPAARKSCQGCHNAYKPQYKEKYRLRRVD